jgi:hypothetical protein
MGRNSRFLSIICIAIQVTMISVLLKKSVVLLGLGSRRKPGAASQSSQYLNF